MKIKYFDIHSHLEYSKFDNDREEVIASMQDEGVFTISIGTDKKTSEQVVRLADRYENLFACIGVHPNDSKEDFIERDYEEMIKNPKVVAVGECGLDFFRLDENAEEEKQRQVDLFIKQIDFAVKYDKPLMIHIRDAHIETLDILDDRKKEYGEKLRGNIHFFSGDTELAQRYIDLGFTISFAGVITFVKEYDDVIKNIPLDKIMSETDAPFVAPVPYRGKRNEPIYVKEVVKRIAEIKELDIEIIKKAMVENAIREFRLDI